MDQTQRRNRCAWNEKDRLSEPLLPIPSWHA